MIRKYCNEKYIVRAYVNNYMSAGYHDLFTLHYYFLLPRSRALRNRGQETEDE